MEWRNVHLRFEELKNDDIVVCKLEEHSNWNRTGIVLAVYQNGLLYDTWSREDDILPCEQWEITDIVCEYSFTGKNLGTQQILN